MRLARVLGLLCYLSAAPASAQPAAMATCADLMAASAEQRTEFAFMSGQWAAGFAQAKILSCHGARRIPTGAEQARYQAAECNFSEASQRYIEMSAAEKERRLVEICQRFPNNDLTMNLILIFADINASARRN